MICLNLLKKGFDILKIKIKFIHNIINSIFYKKNTETITDFLHNIADVYDYNKYTDKKLKESKIKMENIPDEIFEDIHTLTTVIFTISNIGLAACCNVKSEDKTFSYPINFAMNFSKLNLEFHRRCREDQYDLSQCDLLIELEVIRYVMQYYNHIVENYNLSDKVLETINGFLLKLLSTAIANFNNSERES